MLFCTSQDNDPSEDLEIFLKHYLIDPCDICATNAIFSRFLGQ